jgi:hypothetical protein
MAKSRTFEGCLPLGLSREDAAWYIGISPSKFDQLVTDGRMPAPRMLDGRRVWNRHDLELSFYDLPAKAKGNPWDEVLRDGLG